MTKKHLAAFCLSFCLAAPAFAQTGVQTAAPPRIQSLQDVPSTCISGGVSQRVCNDDFTSCSDSCTQSITPNIDPTVCQSRCCGLFNACMHLHGCATVPAQCD